MWCMWECMCCFFLLSLFVVIIMVVIIAGLSANPCFLHYFLCRCRTEKKTITLLFGCIQKKTRLRENDTYVFTFAQNGHRIWPEERKKKWNGHNDNNIVFSSHFLMLSILRGYRSYSLWYGAWNTYTRSKTTVSVSPSLVWLSPATDKRQTNIDTANRYTGMWIAFQLCRFLIHIHMRV